MSFFILAPSDLSKRIRVSCLHLGQYSGKFIRIVSTRSLSLVLLPQTGHNSHFSFPIRSSPQCFELDFRIAVYFQQGGLVMCCFLLDILLTGIANDLPIIDRYLSLCAMGKRRF